MKNLKKLLPLTMAVTMTITALPTVVYADSTKVVTLGANLTEDQRASMYTYFGTSADQVTTIEVNNSQERQYLEGIAPEAQIGTKTYSCAYVEPTTSGGIQVKTANLTYVTSSMIASTLTTSGVENCNVVASAPFAVSGTGALTGIMLAYEKATGTTLNEDQKETASQELVTTTELADSVGQDAATDIINDVKEEVISDNITDPDEIQDTISDAAEDAGVTLTDDQIAQITDLMEQISQYDYDVKSLEKTLNNLSGEDKGFISNIVSSIKDFFTGSSGDGILGETDDDSLGAGTIIDSTLDSSSSDNDSDEDEGFFGKLSHFFKNIFGGSKSDSGSNDSSVNTTDTSNTSTDTTSTDTISTGSTSTDTTATDSNTSTNSTSGSNSTGQSTEDSYSTSYNSNTDITSSESSDDTSGSSSGDSYDSSENVTNSTSGTTSDTP